MTVDDAKNINDNNLLDMNYFLHEDDVLDDNIGEETDSYQPTYLPNSL